jgi:hypothetical protein
MTSVYSNPITFLAECSSAVIEHRGRYSYNAAKLLHQVVSRRHQRIANPDALRKSDRILRIHHVVELESETARKIDVPNRIID